MTLEETYYVSQVVASVAVISLMLPRLDPDFGALIDKHTDLGRAAPALSPAAVWREAAARELASMEQLNAGPAHP